MYWETKNVCDSLYCDIWFILAVWNWTCNISMVCLWCFGESFIETQAAVAIFTLGDFKVTPECNTFITKVETKELNKNMCNIYSTYSCVELFGRCKTDYNVCNYMKPLFNHQYSLIKGPEYSLKPWENEKINQKPNLGPKELFLIVF